MSEFNPLWELRSSVTEALRVANDVDEDASPELHTALREIRLRLHSVLRSVERATDPHPFWPGLAARA
jgi:hypothetical protein